LHEADTAVDLLDNHGARLLRYGGLVAHDSANHELASQLRVDGSEVAIVIDDAGATYPVSIDPVMTAPAWTAEGDQAGSNFGISVATAGDVNGDGFSDVIVGAWTFDDGQVDEGRAFLYLGSAAGLALTPSWTAEGDQTGAFFGTSVATAGDVNGDGFADVMVGAPQFDNGQTDEGRALVYHGSPSGLGASPTWTAEGDQATAYFGYGIGTAGDVNGDGFSDVIVGAEAFDNGQTDEGIAQVYLGSTTGLAVTPVCTLESNQAGAFFGLAVGTAGDVNGDGFSDVIVGAPVFTNGQSGEGRVFVYRGSPSGPVPLPVWTAESDQAGASFGYSVATAGDTNGDGFSDVVIGAYNYDNGETNEGRAYVYFGSGLGLAPSPAWTRELNQASAGFGVSVATAGDVNGDGFADVIVGAYRYDNGETDEGRALVYQGSAAGPSTLAAWTAESNQASAFFGRVVATAGDVNGDGRSDVLVGAYGYDNGQSDEGRVFVYYGGSAGLFIANWNVESDQADALMGSSVATAGDVNGDGFSDLIVGAPSYDNGGINEGRAYVYLGSASGPGLSAAWTAEGNQSGVHFGSSVGTAGDVNGDGFSDVIIGAPYYGNGELNEGRAFVYHGSASGLGPSPAWTAEGDQDYADFGVSVGTAGDVNGDGYSDIIVGAPNYSNDQAGEGRASVYHGSASGLSGSPAWTAESNQSQSSFGASVGTAGDVNGDGFSDVIVGASYYDHVDLDAVGRVVVYHGSTSGLGLSPAWAAEGDQAQALFGNSVGTAGDVNGDGFSDVIVGADDYDHGEENEGRAFAYYGSFAGLVPFPSWSAEGNQSFANFGCSVGSAGDVNGDGYSDVIVGALFHANPLPGEGRAAVYHGSATGLGASAAWTLEGGQNEAQLGTSVASAGDVNGDGFSDVIIGAPRYDHVQTDEGEVLVFYGNQGLGLPRLPLQARADDTALISLLGSSESSSAFRVRALGRSAGGRAKVRLQREVKPLGTPFDGTGVVTGNRVDTGIPGFGGSAVTISQLASELSAGTPYHWRLRILTDSPFFPASPWFTLSGNGAAESDIRTAPGTTAVQGGTSIRDARLLLGAARPNPFVDATTIAYTLPHAGHVRLSAYDATGRQVATLVDRDGESGTHEAAWDGRDARGARLAAGVYFVRLEFDGRAESHKIQFEPR
jgi:hypothetical protein